MTWRDSCGQPSHRHRPTASRSHHRYTYGFVCDALSVLAGRVLDCFGPLPKNRGHRALCVYLQFIYSLESCFFLLRARYCRLIR